MDRLTRMLGQIREDGSRLMDAVLRVASTEQRLRAGLVRPFAKHERTWRALREPAASAADRPPGQRARKRGYVGLRVAAVHSERVKLEDLACEVLVDVQLASLRSRPPCRAWTR